VEIEEPDSLRISPGLSVKVTMPGGRVEVTQGRVSRVSPRLQGRTIGADEARVRAETRIRTVWVDWIAERGRDLPIGMRLEAAIQLPAREVQARLPRSAVRVRDGAISVELVKGPLRSAQPIVLGVADSNFVEVQGVAPGTKVLLTNH
jgi:hypothetical protein